MRGEGQRVDPTPVGLVSIDDGRSASRGRATRTRSSAGPLIVLLRNRSAFGFMHWERIWERNAAQRARSRGMRRDDLDGREVVTCRSETREATGNGDRLAHNPEVARANAEGIVVTLVTCRVTPRGGPSSVAAGDRTPVRQRAKNLPSQARTGWTGRHRTNMQTSLTWT